MAFFNEAWFIHAVDDNVTQLSQQKMSRVMGATRMKNQVIGKTCPFNRLAPAEMTSQVSRDADTVYINPTQSKRRAILRDFVLAVLVDEFDEVKTLTNPQSEFAMMLAMGRNRKLDDFILAPSTSGSGGALGTATTVDEGAESTSSTAFDTTNKRVAAGGTGLTVAKVATAKEKMDTAEVDAEDRYFFYSGDQIRQLLADATNRAASRDFTTIESIANGGFPMDATWYGFKWRMSHRIPLSGTTRSAIAMQKNAVGLAVGLMQEVSIDKAVHKNNNTQVLIKLSGGGVRIDDDGVIEIQTVTTA